MKKEKALIKFLTEQLASVADSHIKLISGFAPHQAPSPYDFDGVKRAANALGKGIETAINQVDIEKYEVPL